MARLRRGAAAAALALGALWACAPGEPGPGALSVRGRAMGTSYTVTVPAALPGDEAALRAAVRAQLDRVDALMSTYREDSELSRLNRHRDAASFPVSQDTFAVLAAARAVSEATGGAFDITVGPLVDAWGFGPDAAAEPPADDDVERLRARTGWDKLALGEGGRTVRKAEPGVQCDLSAIAKGYAVDQVAAALERLGHADYLVEVGGEMRVSGTNGRSDGWRVGIERPDAAGRLVQRILSLTDVGIATSGNYRNFRVAGGRQYGHVLDPRSGRPAASSVASATVLDASAMRADAFATAMLVLGEREGLAVAERESLAALLIVKDGRNASREAASSRFRATMAGVWR